MRVWLGRVDRSSLGLAVGSDTRGLRGLFPDVSSVITITILMCGFHGADEGERNGLDEANDGRPDDGTRSPFFSSRDFSVISWSSFV
jgi:hypothetical protein